MARWISIGIRCEHLGANTLDDMIKLYQNAFSAWDANDLIALATTWQNNNVGETPGFNGDWQRALGSIRTEVLYMPCETDLYFHIDALRQEAKYITNVQFTVIPSIWGHNAGGGSNPDDIAFINSTIKAFLDK